MGNYQSVQPPPHEVHVFLDLNCCSCTARVPEHFADPRLGQAGLLPAEFAERARKANAECSRASCLGYPRGLLWGVPFVVFTLVLVISSAVAFVPESLKCNAASGVCGSPSPSPSPGVTSRRWLLEELNAKTTTPELQTTTPEPTTRELDNYTRTFNNACCVVFCCHKELRVPKTSTDYVYEKHPECTMHPRLPSYGMGCGEGCHTEFDKAVMKRSRKHKIECEVRMRGKGHVDEGVWWPLLFLLPVIGSLVAAVVCCCMSCNASSQIIVRNFEDLRNRNFQVYYRSKQHKHDRSRLVLIPNASAVQMQAYGMGPPVAYGGAVPGVAPPGGAPMYSGAYGQPQGAGGAVPGVAPPGGAPMYSGAYGQPQGAYGQPQPYGMYPPAYPGAGGATVQGIPVAQPAPPPPPAAAQAQSAQPPEPHAPSEPPSRFQPTDAAASSSAGPIKRF